MLASKPAGHPEGGDPSKCPFALMMKAVEVDPAAVERWKAEAAECDTDSEEDEEEAARMEELLGTHTARAETTLAEMERRVASLEGSGEAKERRERMMGAMMHQFSKQDLGSAASMMAKLSPADIEAMKSMGGSEGGEGKESCPFAAMFGAIDKQDAMAAAAAQATAVTQNQGEEGEKGRGAADQLIVGEANNGGHGGGGGGCPFAAMFGGGAVAEKGLKALPGTDGEEEAVGGEEGDGALTVSGTAAEGGGGGGGGGGKGAPSCPFAAMFGMPDQPKKAAPTSIVDKYMRDNNLTEEDLAREAEEDADGGCPFAQIFGAMPAKDEREAARQKLLREADQPGQGQYIWKREQVDAEEMEGEREETEKNAQESESESESEEEEVRGGGRFRKGDVPDTQEGLNEAIRKAGELKSAKMKADPRRREWEAAPVWMRCTCAEEGELGDARALGLEGRLERAGAWREEANGLFRKGRHEAAISVYARSLGIFLWFRRGEGRSTENVKLVDEVSGAAAVGAVVKAFNNIAACLVKMERWAEVVYACGKALHYDPRNVKALYRRAQAYRAENSAYMLELAVKDLKRALSIDPSSADVKRLHREYAAELREQNRKDGKTFGEMFSRGDLYTAEEAEKMKVEGTSAAGVLGNLDDGARALAKQMGIDLNDPRVRAELARLEAAKVAEEKGGKRRLDMKGGKTGGREQHWWIKATLRYKWVVYALIALHVTWRMWVVVSHLPMRAEMAHVGGGVVDQLNTSSALPPVMDSFFTDGVSSGEL